MVSINFKIGLSSKELTTLLINGTPLEGCRTPLDVLENINNVDTFSTLDKVLNFAEKNIKAYGEVAYDYEFATSMLANELHFNEYEINSVYRLIEEYLDTI